MAENPLLPNAELRALHKLLAIGSNMEGAKPEPGDHQPTKRKTVPKRIGSAALLAGTLLQLRAGDLVLPEAEDLLAASTLLRGNKKGRGKKATIHSFGVEAPRLLLAAGLASALRRSGTDHLVLAFVRSGVSEPQWTEALTWAQTDKLPLVLVCADLSGAEAFRQTSQAQSEALEWHSFQRVAGRLKLPILSVDGQDAVAVYRVMQESILRARAHGGPAVLWAVLPSEREIRRSHKAVTSPLDRLEHYLRTRKISFS